ncbi:probable receptor-like protein kinase At5g24010 [Andrographis paniculata]|uniref:probable receptor-like protein kinase At5g24010 n=1 Tax=Andrographis paniculata TaxID=175694 RepID=UPI0021E82805|nr:probable receptor-like protein kinase At5g24010 [Andrographis paniculata]
MLRNRYPSKLAPMATTLLLLVLILAPFPSVSPFSPVDYDLINCGLRAGDVVDADHRVFTGDGSRFPSSTRTVQLESTDSRLASASPLYSTARAFHYPTYYAFPIRDRGQHHLVRLHFHPVQNDYYNSYEAEFHVVANGFLLLRNFRIRKGDTFPLIKEFVIPIASEKLEIALMPSGKSNFGFVNAIEVISAPADLIADVAQFIDVDKNERIDGLLKSGFETLYRVNVGGFKVTPFNDSLWRTWATDDQYLATSQGSEKINFGGRIKYRLGGSTREVGPDNVYNSARLIRSSNGSVPSVNLTWSFEVEKGYRHMVRMHFCDIASMAAGMIYFNVYLNGNLACANLDLSHMTNRLLASPYYADFVTDDMSSGKLLVSVGPSNISLPLAVDAILNGIEIWRLNNSMSSFDGEVCAEFAWRSWRTEHRSGGFLSLVAAMLLLLSVSVYFQWRRTSSAGWSRLPVDISEVSLKSGSQFSSIKT